eukprot:969716-Pelagomonas_calceolata.AAC.6
MPGRCMDEVLHCLSATHDKGAVPGAYSVKRNREEEKAPLDRAAVPIGVQYSSGRTRLQYELII